MSVLSGREVARHCASYTKINPSGVDLAPIQVMRLPTNLTIYLRKDARGYLDRSGKIIEGKKRLLPDAKHFYRFERGGLYELRFPKVDIPSSCTGFAFPRSSVNRLGIIKLETAVFDSGYTGEPTQTIYTPLKALIHKDEALVQLIFIKNERRAQELYRGRYQNEKRA
jgi:deoxycytidine triphosphate deaminase